MDHLRDFTRHRRGRRRRRRWLRIGLVHGQIVVEIVLLDEFSNANHPLLLGVQIVGLRAKGNVRDECCFIRSPLL